ncbi:MAG: hypothetical protein QGF36_04240 [Candidatus Marinimicrobia bacterium]|jgi:hypothetical protein|nr:hypothetical protein [Candidatus Neomarinimicrobiota bacterium]MDP6852972.1 hypothetical protein [Candidatus Neomarinimicrobiota bacterium]MDP6936625.1 hypothetical protein [Candidatus Neomarinimicrobiota bacterium]
MKIVNSILVLTILVGGLVFARSGVLNPRVEENKTRVKSEHFWVKDHSDAEDKQLDRKRSHKRRRKVRKPIKGLR